MLNIKVDILYADIIPKIKVHLAVLGKRAVDKNGDTYYRDLTTSTYEDKIFNDLMGAGAEVIASTLTDICSTYTISNGGSDIGVSFVVFNDRWIKADEEFIGDLRKALDSAITRYLVNFSIKEFLTSITPVSGVTTVPMYGKTYIDNCEVILSNIKTLAYHKRPSSFSGRSYAELLGGASSASEDDWFYLDKSRLDTNSKLKY